MATSEAKVVIVSSSYPHLHFNVKSDDIVRFLRSFEDLAKQSYEFTDDKYRKLIPSLFEGKSRDRVDVPLKQYDLDTEKYEAFKKELISHFRRPGARTDINIHVHKENPESVTNYVLYMESLILNSNQEIPEHTAINLILSGLSPYYIEYVGRKSSVFEFA